MNEKKVKSFEDESFADQERRRREEGLEKNLVIASRKVRERFAPPLHEMVVTATEGMPEELKNRVMRRFEGINSFCDKVEQVVLPEEKLQEFQKYGVPEEKINEIRERQKDVSKENVEEFLKKQIDITAAEVRNGFMAEMGKDNEGKQIMMPNKGFSKFESQQRICNILEKDSSPEALKKVARISLDLNGLKAINDLNASHEQGDAYLLMVKKVLDNPEITSFASERGLSYVATRDGGDEFGLIITSSDIIKSESLNELCSEIENKLSTDPEAARYLDFNEEKVILHYNRIAEKEFNAKSQEEKDRLMAEYRKEIPEGFKFRAYISSGAATLYDAMLDPENDKDQNNLIREDDNSGRVLKKMMSCLFNTSDAKMQASKDEFKNNLAGGDEYEKMMAKIYTRTTKEMEQQKKINELMGMVEGLEDLERANEDLIKLEIDESKRHELLGKKTEEILKKRKL